MPDDPPITVLHGDGPQSRFAVVLDGVVIAVVLWDGGPQWVPPAASRPVELSASQIVAEGDAFAAGVFSSAAQAARDRAEKARRAELLSSEVLPGATVADLLAAVQSLAKGERVDPAIAAKLDQPIDAAATADAAAVDAVDMIDKP